MKSSDFFTYPLKDSYKYRFFLAFMTLVFLTMVPGFCLWLITLGGFRYFHLLDKIGGKLVDLDINQGRNYD